MIKSIKNLINNKEKKIYIIDLFGEITYNKTFNKQNCNAVTICDRLENIYNDLNNNYTVGVLLHINSPGGTTGASEEIANMIKDLRKRNVIIISSVGDICTSGAYLVASQSNYIFANNMSLLGSIGVLMPCVNLNSFSDKTGITVNYLKSGKMKDIGNMFRDMTVEEKQYIENLLQDTHNEFIKYVLSSREIKDIENMTDGRFVNANIALQNNLIDKIGTYYDAFNYLLHKLHCSKQDVQIVSFKEKSSIINQIISSFSSNILLNNSLILK